MKRAIANVAGALALAVTTFAPALTPRAEAAMWCAYPLEVHEWGVHVFGPGGMPAAAGPWPDFFHTTVGGTATASGPSVRDMPSDSGIRFLPVLHFYAPRLADMAGEVAIPVGIEVGFSEGPASAWFPQVDLFRTSAEANGSAAAKARLALLDARKQREGKAGFGQDLPSLGPDPTRQLVWNRLELTKASRRPAAASNTPWVGSARGLPSLWVNGAGESDRFVFYEAQSAAAVPLQVRRGAAWQADRRAYELVNRGATPLHDVFVTQREGGKLFVVHADVIAPGATLAFVLEDHAVAPARLKSATADVLKKALGGGQAAFGPADRSRWMNDCRMMRDPAIPFEKADGHALYDGEIDLMLSVWSQRFFEQPGTTIVYREDEAALDAAMPLSIYTDMFDYIVLQRAGLALWENIALP